MSDSPIKYRLIKKKNTQELIWVKLSHPMEPSQHMFMPVGTQATVKTPVARRVEREMGSGYPIAHLSLGSPWGRTRARAGGVTSCELGPANLNRMTVDSKCIL